MPLVSSQVEQLRCSEEFSLTPHRCAPWGSKLQTFTMRRESSCLLRSKATSETDVHLPSSLPNGHCAGLPISLGVSHFPHSMGDQRRCPHWPTPSARRSCSATTSARSAEGLQSSWPGRAGMFAEELAPWRLEVGGELGCASRTLWDWDHQGIMFMLCCAVWLSCVRSVAIAAAGRGWRAAIRLE